MEDQDFFMLLALLAAQRSKDNSCKVGAVTVNKKNQFVSSGYNGLARGCDDDTFSWKKSKDSGNGDSKDLYVLHAEKNAILNANPNDLAYATLFSTRYPCIDCSKEIVHNGIMNFFYIYKKQEEIFANFKEGFHIHMNSDKTWSINFLEMLGGENKWQEVYDETPKESKEKFKICLKQEKTKDLNYISWNDYIMGIAVLCAIRSKSNEEVSSNERTCSIGAGACIVDDNKIIRSIGYSQNREEFKNVHAPMDAIFKRNTSNITGMHLYTTHFPCKDCAMGIIQMGIKTVIYLAGMFNEENDNKFLAADRMFKSKGIAPNRMKPQRLEIELNFKEYEKNRGIANNNNKPGNFPLKPEPE